MKKTVLGVMMALMFMATSAMAGTWQSVLDSENVGRPIVPMMTFNEWDPGILYALMLDGSKFVSFDDGLTWTESTPRTWMVADPNDSNVLYCVGYYALFGYRDLFMSDDGGATLYPVSFPEGTHYSYYPIRKEGLAVNTAEKAVYYLRYAGFPTPSSAHAYKTTDGGKTWQHVGIWPISGTMKFDPTDPNTIYLGDTLYNSFKSTDGGKTWQPLLLPVFAINPSHPEFVYSAYTGSLAKSRNRGICWEYIRIDPTSGYVYSNQNFEANGYFYSMDNTASGALLLSLGSNGLLRFEDDDFTPYPEDTTPPVISASASPDIIWPANGKAVPVTITATAQDAETCVVSATINGEPVDHTNMTTTIMLTAMPQGKNLDGTTIVIPITATDAAGNTATTTVSIRVPHDRRR